MIFGFRNREFYSFFSPIQKLTKNIFTKNFFFRYFSIFFLTIDRKKLFDKKFFLAIFFNSLYHLENVHYKRIAVEVNHLTAFITHVSSRIHMTNEKRCMLTIEQPQLMAILPTHCHVMAGITA